MKTKTILIGSECVFWFNSTISSIKNKLIDSPIVLFDTFYRVGVPAVLKNELQGPGKNESVKKKFRFSLKGELFESNESNNVLTTQIIITLTFRRVCRLYQKELRKIYG